MAEKLIPYAELNEEQRALVDSGAMWDRRDAAEEGYGLEKLVDDEDYIVRVIVAGHGYGLDKLVDDKNEDVRRAVARQGYGLEVLVEDENESVRAAVARHGYGLDKLVDDPNVVVRRVALEVLGISPEREAESLRKARSDLAQEWAAANPDKCALPENIKKYADDMQYKADCAAIDKVVQDHWKWNLNEKGHIVLDYDPRYDSYSVAEAAYANREKPLEEFRVAFEDAMYSDWGREVEDTIWEIIDAAGIEHNTEREDWAREYIFDTYDVQPPFDELLQEKVKVNIILGTEEEANYDYSLIHEMAENLEEGYEVDESVLDNYLMKIVEAQGYSFEDLAAAYRSSLQAEYAECVVEHGRFLASVVDEMRNDIGGMGAVTVLGTVEARDLPLLCTPGYEFKVSGDTAIGLFGPWAGDGSLLEITLDKPLTIRSEDVYDVQVEGVKTDTGYYSVDDVFGLVPSAWQYPLKVEAAEPFLSEPVKEGSPEGRKPSELKAAVGKPAAKAYEAATPGEDGKVCSASAAARGAEAPTHEVKRQK